jgi:hypothetical protein
MVASGAVDGEVVRVDSQVAPLRPGRLVSGPLDLAAPPLQGGVVVGVEDLGRGYDRGHASWVERGQEGGSDGLVDLYAADAEAVDAVAVDRVSVGAVIAERGVWRLGKGAD